MTPKQRVNHFNASVEVGDYVDVRMPDDSILQTATRAKAQVLGDGSAVVWVDNHIGAVPLERVRASGRRAAQVVALLRESVG